MQALIAGGASFVIEGATVKGVVGIEGMAELAGAPEFVRGIVWFEGEGLPVIDLKARVGLGRTPVDRRSCVAIVELVIKGALLTLGMLVDSELDVVGAMNWLTGGRGAGGGSSVRHCAGGRIGRCVSPSEWRRPKSAAGRVSLH